MGVVSGLVDAAKDIGGGIVGAARSVTGGAYDVVHDVGSSINNAVKKNIPGGWGTVAAVTAAVMSGGSSLGATSALSEGAGALGAASDLGAGADFLGTTVGAPIAGSSMTTTALPGLLEEGAGSLGAASDLAGPLPISAQDPFAYPNVYGPENDFLSGKAAEDAISGPGVAGAGVPTGAGASGLGDVLSKAGNFLGNKLGSTGLTGAGALAGLGGLAGLLSLMRSDNARYGTPGRQNYTGPLSQYKFNPSTYQTSAPDPSMFRPRGGVTTVADQLAMQRGMGRFSPFMGMPRGGQQYDPMQQMAAMAGMNFAKGGETSKKPQYKSKPQLAVMDPWTRAAAEYENAAYRAQSPVAPTAAPTGPQLGQLNLSGGGLGSYSDGGRMLKGPGDGMSDSIPATIGGKRPARLADGEFVVPADVVSHLGNGSTEAGARELYKMMDKIRTARTGRKTQGKQIKPGKFLPK